MRTEEVSRWILWGGACEGGTQERHMICVCGGEGVGGNQERKHDKSNLPVSAASILCHVFIVHRLYCHSYIPLPGSSCFNTQHVDKVDACVSIVEHKNTEAI